MALRERNGRWHFRFMIAGHWYSGATDLAATERNKTAAMRIEAEAHKLVSEGKAHLLRLEPIRFTEAARQFLQWVAGEYAEHPRSAIRIRASFASLKEFFRRQMVATVTAGLIEDYKAYRRVADRVREVTIRHDLHALSLFFQYAKKHTWVKDNPVREVKLPSAEDAVRIHVLTAAEESLYFATCEAEAAALAASRKPRPGGRQNYNGYRDLADLSRLMLLQGCRPEELLALEWSAVDLEGGALRIVAGKTGAAKRTLWIRAQARQILAGRFQADSRYVFPSPRRRGQHIDRLNPLHTKVLAKCGLRFVIYDWRHTFATRAAEAGMPLPTLATILGHANLRSVTKYVHPSQQASNHELERLDALNGRAKDEKPGTGPRIM